MRKKLSLRTTEEEYKIIQQIAESEERSLSAQALVFVRFGIDQYQTAMRIQELSDAPVSSETHEIQEGK